MSLPSLYHYQDFNLSDADDDVARLTDILKNHRIWCSNPANFNDPWDGKPYFDPEHLADAEARAATAEALIATRAPGADLDHIDDRLRTDPEFLKMAIHQFSQQLFDFIASRWGVYCLTPDPCLTLMWSHYARNHRGVCLEFSVPNTKFQAAVEVSYQREYPRLLLHDPQVGIKMLTVKSDDWGYEREFRLVCARFTDVKESPLMMDGNYLNIGPSDLTAVIVGCQAGDEVTEVVRDLVNTHAPRVKFRQARRALNKYRIAIGDLP